MGLMVLILFIGWFTPLFFDRFREERPGLAPLRGSRLYVAALNRFWLDDIYDAYVVRPLFALGRKLDRFDTRFIDWITGVPTPMELPRKMEGAEEGKSLAPRHKPGLAGSVAEAAMSGSEWVEKSVIQKSLNERAPRLGSIFTGAADWIERTIFQQGINRRVPGFGETIAAIAGWLERWVFQAGINEGGPKASRKAGETLLKAEAILGRPLVAGAIFVGFLGFLILILGVLR